MPAAAPRKLTERQRAVMERIDRRVPIKMIAQELGVSETRINQHIRALKDIYEAESLGDLVERFRASERKKSAHATEKSIKKQYDTESVKGYSETSYSKNQVPSEENPDHSSGRVDQGELVLRDASSLLTQAPWLRPGEPQVVPGVLDGEHAVILRLVAIVAIAFGILAAVVLTVTAGVALSEAMDGMAQIPVEETRSTD